MKIAVVGSRDYPAPDLVVSYIQTLTSDTIVLSGGARGVDTWAKEAAQACNLTYLTYAADWRIGRQAGPLRNKELAKAADMMVAFWDGRSRGTLSAITEMHLLGKPVDVILPKGRHLSDKEIINVAATYTSGRRHRML